jgi:hypothetical protein
VVAASSTWAFGLRIAEYFAASPSRESDTVPMRTALAVAAGSPASRPLEHAPAVSAAATTKAESVALTSMERRVTLDAGAIIDVARFASALLVATAGAIAHMGF